MTLPTSISDREMQKFAEPSADIVAERVVNHSGNALASESTAFNIWSQRLPSGLGQKVMTGSLGTTIASNQSDVPLNIFGATAAYSPRKSFSVTAQVQIGSAATDVFVLVGPSSGTTYVTKCVVTGTQGVASGHATLSLLKRSTANSGGSFGTLPYVPHQVGDTTTTLSNHYSTKPTNLGTLVGTIHHQRILVPLVTGSPCEKFLWEVNDFNKPIMLNSTSTLLCVNFNGVTMNTGIFNVTWQYFHI